MEKIDPSNSNITDGNINDTPTEEKYKAVSYKTKQMTQQFNFGYLDERNENMLL